MNIWGSLQFSAKSAGMAALSSTGWYMSFSPQRDLTYVNNRAYKSVLMHVARQFAMQTLESEVNKLFPKYQRYLESNLRKVVLKQQDANMKQLIKDQQSLVDDGFGVIKTDNGKEIIAKDKYGNKIPEALMLYYDGEENVTVDEQELDLTTGQMVSKGKFTTKTLCFYDLTPQVSMSSQKNVVQTTVQGRNYTRKELVSGGDLKFTVNGQIVSDEVDVVPDTAIKKFIQIAEYGGIIKVNHFQFKRHNVEQILILDYNLPTPEFKNIQPYSFTCVAVEPDEDVLVTEDTMKLLNYDIQLSPMSKWYKFILNNKLAEIAANAVTSAAVSAAQGGLSKGFDEADKGIDKLIDHI